MVVPARPGQVSTPGTTAVGTYAPNGYGLTDMTGKVWEWTADFFRSGYPAPGCCAPRNPRVDTPALDAGECFPRRVVKGG